MLRPNDPARTRRLRGQVLRIAYMAANAEVSNPDDPYVISRNVLVGTLEHAGELPSGQDLRAAMRYLEAKGCVEVTWRRDGTGEFDKFRLRAYGIDLVEGVENDRAIELGNRHDG